MPASLLLIFPQGPRTPPPGSDSVPLPHSQALVPPFLPHLECPSPLTGVQRRGRPFSEHQALRGGLPSVRVAVTVALLEIRAPRGGIPEPRPWGACGIAE